MSNFSYSFSCVVNVSHSSLTDLEWEMTTFDPDFDTTGHAISATLILFFLLGVPWNLLIIAAIIKKKLYTQPIIVLLLNFSITNLLVALLVMPFSIVSGIMGEYAFGDTDQIRCYVCKSGVLAILLPWVSFHTLALMAVDRFIYLKKPLDYIWIVTPKRTAIAVLVIWGFCIALSIPPFFGFGEIRFSSTIATCIPLIAGSTPVAQNYFYWILITVEGFVPILTLFILYTWIFCLIRKTLHRRHRRSTSLVTKAAVISTHTRKHTQTQIRLVWLFGTIFIANIVTGLPFVVLVVVVVILGPVEVPLHAYTVPFLLLLSQTVIHPILEVCLINDFSKMFIALGKAICCTCRLTKRSTSTPSSTPASTPTKQTENYSTDLGQLQTENYSTGLGQSESTCMFILVSPV